MALQVPDEVRKELEIDAPRERVWRAVTEPDELLGWFPTHGAEVDLRPGGLVRFRWGHGAGESVVVEGEPPWGRGAAGPGGRGLPRAPRPAPSPHRPRARGAGPAHADGARGARGGLAAGGRRGPPHPLSLPPPPPPPPPP